MYECKVGSGEYTVTQRPLSKGAAPAKPNARRSKSHRQRHCHCSAARTMTVPRKDKPSAQCPTLGWVRHSGVHFASARRRLRYVAATRHTAQDQKPCPLSFNPPTAVRCGAVHVSSSHPKAYSGSDLSTRRWSILSACCCAPSCLRCRSPPPNPQHRTSERTPSPPQGAPCRRLSLAPATLTAARPPACWAPGP